MRCIFCGRLTTPAVLLSGNPVGPKCAARAGLLDKAKKGRGQIRLYTGPRLARADDRTLDLFGEQPA